MTLEKMVWLVTAGGVLILGGCTQYSEKKAFKEEPSFVDEEITSVVLWTGREVTFTKDGGRVTMLYTVVGITTRGDTARIPSTKIEEVRGVGPPFIPTAQDGKLRFAEALLLSGHLVRFGPQGGRVATGLLSGRDRSGNNVEYPVGEVAGLRITAPKPVPRETLLRGDAAGIAEVVTFPEGRLIIFDSTGGRSEGCLATVSGFIAPATLVSIPLDSVLYARVKRVDAGKTFLASFGGVVLAAAGVVAIIAATKQCCPFIYSYDGAKYVFDAEPLGGATTAGLARTDHSRLPHLQPVDGQYRLLVRNEVDETQFVDRIRLFYVDHDSSVTTVSDGPGSVLLVGRTHHPLEARDEHGTDLMPFLRGRDDVAWESHMAPLVGRPLETTRHTITLRFLKPREARQATLIVHGGTTLWGSNMIRIMYELRGSGVDRWYDEVDRKGPALYDLLLWLNREELYTLKVHVWKGETWCERGTIVGGGPLRYEPQAVPIAVGGVEGDSLVIQLRPPIGFWSFDQIDVVYGPIPSTPLTPVRMLTAADRQGHDLMEALSAEDGNCLIMPDRENETTLTFEAPSCAAVNQRSFFLSTSGYYRLHLQKRAPEDLAIINRLGAVPGEIVRLSTERYMLWRQSARASLSSAAPLIFETSQPGAREGEP